MVTTMMTTETMTYDDNGGYKKPFGGNHSGQRFARGGTHTRAGCAIMCAMCARKYRRAIMIEPPDTISPDRLLRWMIKATVEASPSPMIGMSE